MEFGAWNVRAQKQTPARMAAKTGVEEAASKIVKILEETVGAQLGFSLPGVFSDVESGASKYELTAAIEKE
jgi:hypothetical protein